MRAIPASTATAWSAKAAAARCKRHCADGAALIRAHRAPKNENRGWLAPAPYFFGRRPALIRPHAYAVFATRPLASTYQRSLGKALPARRAFIQSAASTEGVGPRLADGAPPT